MRKFLTFFLTALLAFGVGWAETVTFDVGNGSGLLTEIDANNKLVLSNNVLLTFEKASSQNTPVYNSNGNALRFYQNNTLTVSTYVGNITSIVFTYANNYDNKDVELVDNQPGEYDADNNTWTGTSESVQFINTGTVTRITKIVVTYEVPEAPQPTAKSYVRVTDASQLEGKNVILVYENGNSSYAMGAIESSNSRGAGIPIAVTDNRVSITDEAVTEFTFSGTATNCFLAISQGQYLAYSASGKFGTSTTTSNFGKECWKTSAKNGGFYLASVYESGYGIRLYTSTNQFAPFKTGDSYKEAILYVKEEGAAPVTPPSLSASPTSLTIGEGGGSFNVTGTNLGDNVGVELTNGDVFTRTLSSSTNEFRNNETGNWYFIKDNDGELTGTVAVAYNGRDLTATSTVTMGTNKLDSDEDEVAQVTVTYQPDIYIVGDYRDGNLWGWANGIKMDYNNGEYSKTVTITNAGSCIMFARTADGAYSWNDNRLFFGASNSADWIYGESTDNHLATETSGQYYPIKFNQPGDYKITINAAEKTFTVTSNGVANLTEANALDKNDEFKFNGRVVVTYKDGTDLWIRDVPTRSGSTTAGYIYNYSGASGFAQGDVIKAGWTATKDVYNGLDEFKNAVGLEKDGTADFDPEVIEAINPETDINKYVKFEGVDKIVDNAGNTVQLYDKFGT